jgi:hypothetical protein
MRTFLFAAAAVLALSASARALTPAQLNPDEQKVYEGLKSDPDAARSYLATRGFVKNCQLVAAKKAPAINLPLQPANYDVQYVTDPEQADVDKAVLRYVSAKINSASKA